jgi:hypothetical protein
MFQIKISMTFYCMPLWNWALERHQVISFASLVQRLLKNHIKKKCYAMVRMQFGQGEWFLSTIALAYVA